MNFRPFEEFYELSKTDQLSKSKRTVTFEEDQPTERKLKATGSTAALYKDNSPLPKRVEFSPSPIKAPNQENTFKYEYSSMIAKLPMFSNNASQAEINTFNDEADKENNTEVEIVRPVQVVSTDEDKETLCRPDSSEGDRAAAASVGIRQAILRSDACLLYHH